MLKVSSFETQLGTMIAMANDSHLYLLEFIDKEDLEQELESLKSKYKIEVVEGMTSPIKSIQVELKAYFEGTLKKFKTPLYLSGTAFQKDAWNQLLRIPYGQTRSYVAQAHAIGKPSAFRAVANANGANHMVIVIPCHRIINSNGKLGGYSSGLKRKEWLLNHELSHAQK